MEAVAATETMATVTRRGLSVEAAEKVHSMTARDVCISCFAMPQEVKKRIVIQGQTSGALFFPGWFATAMLPRNGESCCLLQSFGNWSLQLGFAGLQKLLDPCTGAHLDAQSSHLKCSPVPHHQAIVRA